MERVLPWLALVFAVGAIVLAVFEIDQRADEAPLAVPTAAPSPTRRISPPPTGSPAATVTVRPTTSPVAEPTSTEPQETQALPTTTRTATPAPTAAATATPRPPPTPTPPGAVAAETPGPTDDGRGATPHTGGGALVPGIVIASFALLARAGLRTRSR